MPWISLTTVETERSILVNTDHIERVTPASKWVDDPSHPDGGATLITSRLWFRCHIDGVGLEALDVREGFGTVRTMLTRFYPLPD